MTAREDRFNRIVSGMESQLKDHKILSQDDKTVLLGNPNGCSNFRCEIISSGGYLIVCGDNDIMCFGYDGKTTVQQKIAWMGRPFSEYVREKAHIGMTSGLGCEVFDSEIAVEEIHDHMMDPGSEEGDREGWKRVKVRVCEVWPDETDFAKPIDEVLKLEAGDIEQRDLWDIIYKELEDCEHLDIGVVPSGRLISAWCLVKKANELLHAG